VSSQAVFVFSHGFGDEEFDPVSVVNEAIADAIGKIAAA